MELRVLGPLEVVEGDLTRPMGGRRQRALLADLIVHANRVVSVDRLIEDVWAGEPPATAHHALQVYVSRLRTALRDGDGIRIALRAPGYELDVDEDRLDLTRFEHLVAEGRRTLAEGRDEDAAARLRAGLALWRGEPFADLGEETFLEPEISRLNDLRLAALEDRIVADLSLGRHAEVLPELCLLLDEHPTRERLRTHLMLALYRSGRQAEALAAYDDAREALGEELGIDPGQDLQRLRQAILLQDPALEWIPRTVRRTGPVVRKLLSALVAVVRASGPAGAQPDPEALPAVLRRVEDRVRIAVERHGGTSVSTGPTGSFSTIFGVPVAHEDDALRAVRAGLDLRTDLDRLDATLGSDGVCLVDVRIAVATGEALTHEGGSISPPTGDVLNAAERLATGAGTAEILMDGATHRLVANAVRTRSLTADTFRVLEVTAGIPGYVPRLRAPLVGRDLERGIVERALRDSVDAGSCRVVTILGEPGIGKSRLADEIAVSVAAEATVLRGRCLSYGEGVTFSPIVEIVRRAIDVSEADTADVVRSGLGAIVRPTSANALAELLRLPNAVPQPRQIFVAVLDLLTALAAARPLVIILDDLQWAEPTLLDVIEHVAARMRAPALLLCVARPQLLERRPGWLDRVPGCATVEVASLTAVDAEAMVTALFGPPVPEGITATVVDIADGNPLYVEELVAMLIDDGIVSRAQDGWIQVRPLPEAALPLGLKALLQARLEALPGQERTIVEIAAIEGKRFHTGTVLALAGAQLAPDDLRGALGGLLERDVIRPDRPLFAGERAFRFRHQLIRDAAYGRIPKARRADLHERLADRLESLGGSAEPEPILGYHLEQAYKLRAQLGEVGIESLGARAAAKLDAAGRRAGERGDDTAAANLLERAAALLPVGAARASLLLEASDVPLWAYRQSRARELATEAAAVARSIGERSLEVQAECTRSMAALFGDPTSPDRAELLTCCETAERILGDCGDDVGLVRVLLIRSQMLEEDCRFVDEVTTLRRAVELATRHGMRRHAAISRYLLAGAYCLGPGPVGDALVRCREILEADPDDPLLEFGVTWRMAYLEAAAGRATGAQGLLEHAPALGEEYALAGSLRNLYYWRGEIDWVGGDLPSAEASFRACLESATAEGNLALAGWTANALGLVLLEEGRYEEAERVVRIAEAVTVADDVSESVRLHVARSRLAVWRGDLPEAEAAAREAVRLSSAAGSPEMHGDAFRALGDALLADGRIEEAEAALRDALAAYEGKGLAHRAAAVRARIGVARDH